MRKMFFLLAIAMISLTGCRGYKLIGSEETHNTDSIVTRIEYIERIDTAYIDIIHEVQQVIEDTASVLENSYCISEARITSNGLLYHSLETKPQQKPVPVKSTEIVRDSIVYKYRYKFIKDKEFVPVEREFTKAELFKLNNFWYVLSALVLSLIWIFRKPIKSFLYQLLK
jgi:hypothetical protein